MDFFSLDPYKTYSEEVLDLDFDLGPHAGDSFQCNPSTRQTTMQPPKEQPALEKVTWTSKFFLLLIIDKQSTKGALS